MVVFIWKMTKILCLEQQQRKYLNTETMPINSSFNLLAQWTAIEKINHIPIHINSFLWIFDSVIWMPFCDFVCFFLHSELRLRFRTKRIAIIVYFRCSTNVKNPLGQFYQLTSIHSIPFKFLCANNGPHLISLFIIYEISLLLSMPTLPHFFNPICLHWPPQRRYQHQHEHYLWKNFTR